MAQLLKQARDERATIWDSILKDSAASDEILPDNIDEIGALYCDLRIDFGRVMDAVSAGGNLSGIAVDPCPEKAGEGEFTVLDAYFTHFRLVIDETCRQAGLKEVDLSNPEHVTLFNQTEENLLEAGKSVNPLI